MMSDKKCKIANERFSWILDVDGHHVLFDGASNAEYFEQHYLSLGYSVEVDREAYKLD
jgi:metal-dependent hydrolase (beta-lactamase superfamily II)